MERQGKEVLMKHYVLPRLFRIAKKIMSPTDNAFAADNAREQPKATGRERTDSPYGETEEVKEADGPQDTQQRLIILLNGLAERMDRLEASQKETRREGAA